MYTNKTNLFLLLLVMPDVVFEHWYSYLVVMSDCLRQQAEQLPRQDCRRTFLRTHI